MRRQLTAAECDLIEGNLPLARYLARAFRPHHPMHKDDRLSAATFGLILAAMTSDPGRGKFSQHATIAIKRSMNRAFLRYRLIVVPRKRKRRYGPDVLADRRRALGLSVGAVGPNLAAFAREPDVAQAVVDHDEALRIARAGRRLEAADRRGIAAWMRGASFVEAFPDGNRRMAAYRFHRAIDRLRELSLNSARHS